MSSTARRRPLARVAAVGDGAADRVGDGAGDVPGFGVAELPGPTGAGLLPRGAGHPGVPAALPAGELLGGVAQQRPPEPPHGLRRELQVPVGAALEEAAVVHGLFNLRERPRGDGRVLPQLAGQCLQVQVIQPGAVVGLGELLGEFVQFGEVLQHAGAVAEAQPLLAVELFGTGPVLAGAQRLQVGIELAQLCHKLRRAERLGGELHQFRPLLGGHGAQHPLGGGRALGQRVDQLLDRLRVLREELAVFGHELLEVRVRVLATAVLVEEFVEVAQHLGDGGAVLLGGAFERLLHAGEPLVQDLAAQQVLDLLVGLPGGAGLPVVGGELVDRRGRGLWQVLQLHLAEGAVRVVHPDVAGQLLALLQHGGLQQLLDLVQRPVQLVPAQEVLPPLPHAAGEFVQPFPVPAAAAQVLLQGVPGRVAGHHVLGDGVERLRQVHRRRERIGSARVAAVAGPVVNTHGSLLSLGSA